MAGDFGKGLATGIAIAEVAIHGWFAVAFAGFRAAYAASPDLRLPGLTQLVISPAWLALVPALGALAVIALGLRRPRRLGPYVATAALLAITVVITAYFAQAPIPAP